MEKRETRDFAAIAFDCQSSMTELLIVATDEGRCAKEFLHSRDVQQMQDRFDQWAGNLGVLQPFDCPLSLERRLRDGPIVRETILKSLTDLHYSIHTGKIPFARSSRRLMI